MLLAWILNGHWYQVDYVLFPHAHSYAYTNSHMTIAFVEKILGVPEFLCHFFGHPIKKKKSCILCCNSLYVLECRQLGLLRGWVDSIFLQM